ncbi:hypothetical protein Tco_1026267, partial [Tanacetum coccineum]
ISFDYHVPLGFGSIAGGLDHVNMVIRLPLERGISRESWKWSLDVDLEKEEVKVEDDDDGDTYDI